MHLEIKQLHAARAGLARPGAIFTVVALAILPMLGAFGLMACGSSSGQGDKAKTPPKPPYLVVWRGAIETTPALAREAKATELDDDALWGQGYQFIGLVATDAKNGPEDVVLKSAGERGGELVRFEKELTVPPCPLPPPAPKDEAKPADAGAASGKGGAAGDKPAADPKSGGGGASGAGGDAAKDSKDAKAKDDKPAQSAKDKPADDAKDKPADETKDKPADETKDKPTEPAKDKPADKPAEAQAKAEAPAPACPEAIPMTLGWVWAKPQGVPEATVALWQASDQLRRMHVAVKKKDLKAVQDFASAGGDINRPDVYGHTALHLAAVNRDGDFLAMLIGLGANVDPPLASGQSLLEYAVASEAVRYGPAFAEFNLADHHAALAALVSAGAKPYNALVIARDNKYCATVEHLLSLGLAGVTCDSDAKTAAKEMERQGMGRALRLALDQGDEERVMALLKLGADLNYVDDKAPWDISAIAKAAVDANSAAFAFLIKKGAKYAIEDNEVMQGLLRDAAAEANKDLVKQLLKKKVNVTTALHSAATGKDPNGMVPIILGAKPDINVKDKQGETALFALLRKGCPTESDAKKKEAQAEAFDKVASKLVPTLLKAKADPNLAPDEATTPLDLATRCGLKKTEAALKKAGAKPGKAPAEPEKKAEEPKAAEPDNKAEADKAAASENKPEPEKKAEPKK